jgi:hypothetical protein
MKNLINLMLNWIRFWIIKVVKMVNKNLLVLDLADGLQKLANISSFEEVTSVADADLMLIEQGTAQAIRKVSIEDLKAEFGGGGGTGNYHVLVVDFLENEDYETTTIVPEGAQIDKLVVYCTGGLTNGTQPLTFTIGGTSNIVLATQGVEFDNSISGAITVPKLNDSFIIIVGTGEAGTFQSNWSGAGFGTGNGKAYLFYWTPLP